MRVLHIDTGRQMLGGQHQVKLLLKLLAGAAVETKLLAREGSPLAAEAKRQNLPFAPATVRNVFIYACHSDVVHAHDARAHTMAAIASSKPLIVSRRVAFAIGTSVLSRWKYHHVSRFLAVSQFVANQLETAGVPRGKIDVVYDAVEPVCEGLWDPSTPAVAIQSADPNKARDLIEASSKFSGIPVTFSKNLASDLCRASMFVYITRSEGLGSAAILAMRMGIPVVASRIGGLAEVFEHERSGLYTENSPEAIAGAMCRVIAERDLTGRMIAAARTRAIERFSPTVLLEQTLSAYRKTLNG